MADTTSTIGPAKDQRDIQYNYSPDNRLSLDQMLAISMRLMDRHGVSYMRARLMAEETQTARQAILDERVKAAGGKTWAELRAHPEADALWTDSPGLASPR